MKLEKYKNHLFQNIKRKLSEWFDSEGREMTSSSDLYRFLHSIKGMAGTLQLDGLMIFKILSGQGRVLRSVWLISIISRK